MEAWQQKAEQRFASMEIQLAKHELEAQAPFVQYSQQY